LTSATRGATLRAWVSTFAYAAPSLIARSRSALMDRREFIYTARASFTYERHVRRGGTANHTDALKVPDLTL
jgi:hypothetical protein